ncbi:DUF6193 family natural product biosynthesis protein [Streptomyces sp. Isolate_45]|uniref:DUF6193 family natural product biosynthesis protein n=1 Tax=Streptomyces sp. Isolate_45 TaxID=2950111 RepID=UPI002481C4F4|nr:DUF6193 family natural product biosynthesis protein [Streptomyces sp. Isolate_45]MDA5282632.1 DUF6193 family natural product biosynthesis protein [Streptomyces sp. Isolate_45]
MHGWSRGVELVSGSTDDLTDVVRAGVAWGRGKGIRDLRAELPFLSYDEEAEAYERGPAALVELQWRLTRQPAAEAPEFPRFGELLEAAGAEPRLRRLYVYSSHWTLGFGSGTGHPYEIEVALSAPAGAYRVLTHPHGDVIGEAGTARDAVAMAVGHLPAEPEPDAPHAPHAPHE